MSHNVITSEAVTSSAVSSGAATSGQVLTADGSGGASFEDASGGGGGDKVLALYTKEFASNTAQAVFVLPVSERGDYSSIRVKYIATAGDAGTGGFTLTTGTSNNPAGWTTIGAETPASFSTGVMNTGTVTFSVPDGGTYSDDTFAIACRVPGGGGGGGTFFQILIEGVVA